jgi:methylated-DNA-[protein]-cysteine S-methyltransferase
VEVSMSETRVAYYESPIGRLEVRGGERGVSAVTFVDELAPRAARGSLAVREGKGPLPAALTDCLTQLDEYFRGRRRTFSVKLDLGGTAFQNKVWRALRAVRFGKTASYKDIAKAVGNPAATRAVGGANHSNPVSIIVPCHRVVGSDGRLTGYGGGLWRKEWLLRHEGNDPSSS